MNNKNRVSIFFKIKIEKNEKHLIHHRSNSGNYLGDLLFSLSCKWWLNSHSPGNCDNRYHFRSDTKSLILKIRIRIIYWFTTNFLNIFLILKSNEHGKSIVCYRGGSHNNMGHLIFRWILHRRPYTYFISDCCNRNSFKNNKSSLIF